MGRRMASGRVKRSSLVAKAACAWLIAAGAPAGSQRATCPDGLAGPPACRDPDSCYERQPNGSISARPDLCQGGSCVHTSPGHHTCECPPGSAVSDGESGEQHRRCCPDPAPCQNGHRVVDDKCRRKSCSCDGPCLPGCDTCRNGGTCVSHGVLGEEILACHCPVGFSGEDCGIAEFADACDLRPCQNGATCLPMFGRRECQCALGFSGEDCEVVADEVCITQYHCNPRNTATCQHGSTGDHCQCVDGFRGDRCDDVDIAAVVEANPCQSVPCRNGGECEPVPAELPALKLVAVGVDSPGADLFSLTVPDTGFTPDVDCNRTRFHAGCKMFAAFAPDGQRVRVQVDATVQPYTVVQVPLPHRIDGAGNTAAISGSPDSPLTFRCVCSSGFIGAYCEISEDSFMDTEGLVPDDVFGNCGRLGFCCAAGGFCSQVFHYAACECRRGWTSTPGAATQDCAVPEGVEYDPLLHSPTRPECMQPTTTNSGGSTHALPAGDVVGSSFGAASSGNSGVGDHGTTRGGRISGVASTPSGAQQSQFSFYAHFALGLLGLVTACCCARRWHRLKREQFTSKEAVEELFEMH